MLKWDGWINCIEMGLFFFLGCFIKFFIILLVDDDFKIFNF